MRFANPISTFIITGPDFTYTTSDPAELRALADRIQVPVTIREVFPDGSGRWIVPPAGCAPFEKPAGPPVAQPEPEPVEFVGRTDSFEEFEVAVIDALMHDIEDVEISHDTARRIVELYNEWMETMYDDHWTARAAAADLVVRRQLRKSTKRKRRRTWECPMPQTLLIAGVDVIAETRRLLSIVPDLRGAPMPHIYVRRHERLRRRHGTAVFSRNHIRLIDAPELDRFDVVETLAHELGHLNAYRLYKDSRHGQHWRMAYRHIASYGYGVDLKVDLATHGEMSTKMRGGRTPMREALECLTCR